MDLLACQVRVAVPLVEFMYLVFTRMPGESRCTSRVEFMYLVFSRGIPGESRCTSRVEFMYLVFTRMPGGVYVPCIYSHARWSLCTLDLLACQVEFMYLGFTRMPCARVAVPLVEFMYLVCTRMPGGVYVPCIYSYTR